MRYQLLAVVVTLCATAVRAEPGAKSTTTANTTASVTTKEIQQQIERLASAKFQVRDVATRRLIEIGPPAVNVLKNTKTSDAEVAARIKRILHAIRQSEAARKLAEIIDKIRENEKLYSHIDFVVRKKYRLVKPVPDDTDSGLVLFTEELHRYVYQGNLFYLRRMGFGEAHGGSPDYTSTNLIAAYDGDRTRMQFGHKPAASIYDGYAGTAEMLRPHHLLLNDRMDRSFSQMLVTKTINSFRIDVSYKGEDVVDGRPCEKIRIESWYRHAERKPTNTTARLVWLARDRNYLPIKTVVGNPQRPVVIGRVTELRKIAPGVWFPFRADKKVMDLPRGGVRNLTEYQTLRVRLNPKHKLSLFRDIHIPYDSLISEIKHGKLVREYHQQARYHPSKTSLGLLGPTTDERLRQSLIGLKNLRELNVGSSQITDAGLKHLKNVPKLEDLNLFGTSITGTGLKHLVHVPKLRNLNMGETRISDDSLAHLKPLAELTHLDLSGCLNITHAGLKHLTGLTKLESLILDDCGEITDAGLTQIARLKNLQWLTLKGALVTDEGLTQLHKLRKLQIVVLRGCPVTEAGVVKLRKALPDCKVKYRE